MIRVVAKRWLSKSVYFSKIRVKLMEANNFWQAYNCIDLWFLKFCLILPLISNSHESTCKVWEKKQQSQIWDRMKSSEYLRPFIPVSKAKRYWKFQNFFGEIESPISSFLPEYCSHRHFATFSQALQLSSRNKMEKIPLWKFIAQILSSIENYMYMRSGYVATLS